MSTAPNPSWPPPLRTSTVCPADRDAMLWGLPRSAAGLTPMPASDTALDAAACRSIIDRWGPMVGVSPPMPPWPSNQLAARLGPRGLGRGAPWRLAADRVLAPLVPPAGRSAWPLPNLNVKNSGGKPLAAVALKSACVLLVDRRAEGGPTFWVAPLTDWDDGLAWLLDVAEAYAALDLHPPLELVRLVGQRATADGVPAAGRRAADYREALVTLVDAAHAAVERARVVAARVGQLAEAAADRAS